MKVYKSPKNKKQINWTRVRVYLVFMIFVTCLLGLGYRSFFLQIIKGKHYSELSRRQHVRVAKLPRKRGNIYDRKKEPFALSIKTTSITADATMVSHPGEYAKLLDKYLGLDKKKMEKKLSQDSRFVWVARRLDPSLKKNINAMQEEMKKRKMAGLFYITEGKRYYPHTFLAANLIGFIGSEGKGLEGLELKFNRQMTAQGVNIEVVKDNRGRKLFPHQEISQEDSEGHNLVLTLDSNLQYVAEKYLKQAVTKHKALNGFVVVMDVSNGEILALANYPSYDLNRFKEFGSKLRKNYAVTNLFEPGSTLKIIAMAAALEEKKVQQGEKIFCENGKWAVGGKIIHDSHPYQWLTPREIIKFSSNIGVGKIMDRLSAQKLYFYLRKFGFGKKSGIDLPGEGKGILSSPKKWSKIGYINRSFGQGISITGVQLAAAFAAVANGGTLFRPRLVKKIVTCTGKTIKEFAPQAVDKVISRETAAELRVMLEKVMEQDGTGVLARVPGYRVGGKTGTAQKADRLVRGYARGKYIASFAGIAPIDNPRIAVVAVVDEPQGKYYGGVVAGPVFSKVVNETLRYLKVIPSSGSKGLVLLDESED